MFWIAIICVCVCPALLAVILGVLGIFIPLGPVCHFLAYFAGAATVLFTLGNLSGFDITDSEDWLMLALGLLIPGGITALLVLLGNWLGDLNTFAVLELLTELF